MPPPCRAHPRRLMDCLVLLLLAAAFTPVEAIAAPPVPPAPPQAPAIDFAAIDPTDHAYDYWYLTELNGEPAGYWRDWLIVEKDRLRTGYEDVRHASHSGQATITRMRVEWVETRDYQPIQITTISQTDDQTITGVYRFTDDGIELTSRQNSRMITRGLPPIKGEYLTAAQRGIAIRVLRARVGRGGGDGDGDNDGGVAVAGAGNDASSFSLQTLDPLVGLTPYTSTYERAPDRDTTMKLKGAGRVDASAWRVRFSVLPGFVMHEWADANQRVVGLSFKLSGLDQVSRLADRSVVNTAFASPEMSGRSIVTPDKPLRGVGRLTKVVYELRSDAMGREHLPMQSAHQRVELIEPGRVRVTVDLKAERAATPEGDRPTPAHLDASVRVDHEAPAVRRLAAQAVEGLDPAASAEAIARACRRAVSGHLTQSSLAIGDGTASEAARTGRGDCTEAAVLLAALLRANNIPSRCVTGLIYSAEPFAGQRDVFVYHMWTQAWVEDEEGAGRWLDLDAAMGRYAAGHIALGSSAMGVDAPADQAALLPFMQDLTIKIVETKR